MRVSSLVVCLAAAVVVLCCCASVSADPAPNTVSFYSLDVKVCTDSHGMATCVATGLQHGVPNMGCIATLLHSTNFSLGYGFTDPDADSQMTVTEYLYSMPSCQGDVYNSAAATLTADVTTAGLYNVSIPASALPLVQKDGKPLTPLFNFTVSTIAFAAVMPPPGTITFVKAEDRLCASGTAGHECVSIEIDSLPANPCVNLANSTYSQQVNVNDIVNGTTIAWSLVMHSQPNCAGTGYQLTGYPQQQITFNTLAYGPTNVTTGIIKLTKQDGSPIIAGGVYNCILSLYVNVEVPQAPDSPSSTSRADGLIGLPSFLIGLGVLLTAGIIFFVCMKKQGPELSSVQQTGQYHSMA